MELECLQEQRVCGVSRYPFQIVFRNDGAKIYAIEIAHAKRHPITGAIARDRRHLGTRYRTRESTASLLLRVLAARSNRPPGLALACASAVSSRNTTARTASGRMLRHVHYYQQERCSLQHRGLDDEGRLVHAEQVFPVGFLGFWPASCRSIWAVIMPGTMIRAARILKATTRPRRSSAGPAPSPSCRAYPARSAPRSRGRTGIRRTGPPR